jgi:HemX protein
MLGLIDLLTAALPLLYGLTAVNYTVYFLRRDPFAERTCTPFLACAALTHLVFVVLLSAHFARVPVATLPEAINLIALSMVVTYLYVERIEGHRSTGVFILPLVVILQLTASALLPHSNPGTLPQSHLFESSLFGLHAIAAILGYTAFAVGAVYGLMYLLLYRALKAKNFGLMFERLPSLDVLSKMVFGATFLGWIFLTVTIGLGVGMSLGQLPEFYLDPKFLSTIAVWAVYGGGVLSWYALNWRGARSVYFSLAGFIFAVVAMMGSAFFWRSFHAFLT